MSLQCDIFYYFLALGPIVWCVGDDIFVFISGFNGPLSHLFYSLLGRHSSCIFPQCSLVAFFMPPRQRMSYKRGGGSNIGHKRVFPFSYDSVAMFFDVVPLEVRK